MKPVIDATNKSYSQVFEEILDHMLAQGKPCIVDEICRYYDGNNHCAIGFLLEPTDEIKRYSADVENLVMDLFDDMNTYTNARFITIYNSELKYLQRIHDVVSKNNNIRDGFNFMPIETRQACAIERINKKVYQWFKINDYKMPKNLDKQLQIALRIDPSKEVEINTNKSSNEYHLLLIDSARSGWYSSKRAAEEIDNAIETHQKTINRLKKLKKTLCYY